jgi:cellobiose phosphorylase
MRYGYFDDKTREYVITRPDTPCRGLTSGLRRIFWFDISYRRRLFIL